MLYHYNVIIIVYRIFKRQRNLFFRLTSTYSDNCIGFNFNLHLFLKAYNRNISFQKKLLLLTYGEFNKCIHIQSNKIAIGIFVFHILKIKVY